jgi:hypothetical protein
MLKYVVNSVIRSGAVALLLLVNMAVLAAGGATKVYITRTAHKYHRETCRCLKKSRIEVTLSEAMKRGAVPRMQTASRRGEAGKGWRR